MNDRSQPCQESALQILVHGDEESAEYRAAAAHVDDCQNCQRLLSEIAAPKPAWNEAASFLADQAADFELQSPGPSANATTHCVDNLRHMQILSAPSHPETLGRVGRYEVQRVLGHGGMGIVLLAHDMELNRPTALKILLPHLASHGPARHRFSREARAAAAIMHEHVVSIHDVISDHSSPYLVMQYVPGQSLQERVDTRGPLAPKEVLRIGMQTALGLAAAHDQGVVHRDIKPSNILLENDVERALLTDFGLARAVDDATVTRTGVVAGTPHFMSPEQATGHEVNFRSDLFSLGATLYFAATGRPPFRADAPVAVLKRICDNRHRPVWQLNPDIPFELSDLIDRLLEKKLRKRPSSAQEVAGRLGKLLAKVQAPQNRAQPWWRRIVRHRSVRTGTLSLACAILAFIGFLSFQSKDAEKAEPAAPTAPLTPAPLRPGSGDTEAAGRSFLDLGVSPTSEFWQSVEEANLQLETLEQAMDKGAALPMERHGNNRRSGIFP